MEQMAFEVKQKTQIKVGIYGKEYVLHKPTVNEAAALAEAKASGSSLEDAKAFMATLGLPREVSGEMEVDHFNLLLEAVLDMNKKK